jgi:hypothetical protein
MPPAGLVTLLTHVDFVKGASKQCINGKLVLPVSCGSERVYIRLVILATMCFALLALLDKKCAPQSGASARLKCQL